MSRFDNIAGLAEDSRRGWKKRKGDPHATNRVMRWDGMSRNLRKQAMRSLRKAGKDPRKMSPDEINDFLDQDPDFLGRMMHQQDRQAARQFGHRRSGRQEADVSRFDQLAQLDEAKSYTDEELLSFMRSQKPGYAMTVAELAYAFGGQSSAHTARLKKLVKMGKLKVLPGKTLGKGTRYGLAESRFDTLAGLTEGNDALLQQMLKSTRSKLKLGMSLHKGDKKKAVAYAKKHTTAGPRVWKILAKEFDLDEDVAVEDVLTESVATTTLDEIEKLLGEARS